MKRLLPFLALSAVCHAGDIRVAYDTSGGQFSSAQLGRMEAARSLLDWIVLSNGMTGDNGIVDIVIHASRIDGAGGILAQTFALQWEDNPDGKVVFTGVAHMHMDLDDSCLTWEKDFIAGIFFHEALHPLGIDDRIWWHNGYVNGTWGKFGKFTHDGQYHGPALAAYQAEYDPLATFIPITGGHLAESINPLEIMTPAWHSPPYVSATMVQMVADNGWTVNPNFQPGPFNSLLPRRRLMDEDIVTQ